LKSVTTDYTLIKKPDTPIVQLPHFPFRANKGMAEELLSGIAGDRGCS